MKTKKEYMQPEIKTVVIATPSSLLAGSGDTFTTPTDGPTGEDWGEE